MNSFIREIFLSSILGVEKIKLPQSKKYEALDKKENRLYEKLIAPLSPELFEILDEFINTFLDKHAIESEQYYAAGFKTGMRLAMETLNLCDVFEN